MWSNQKSLKVVVPQKLRFRPPYCPNESCLWHDPEIAANEGCFYGHGSRKIDRYPYISPRFRCRRCGRVFVSSFFTLNYRDHTRDMYEEIADLRLRGATKSQIAEFLDCSLDTVLRKHRKIARWSLLALAKDRAKVRISEPIAYDGIENFSFSQFDPNNINHAVGRESYFIYDFNFAPFNRKGKMSERQQIKARAIESKHGRYPSDAIFRTSERIFRRLIDQAEPKPLVLHTDNHYAYRKALAKIRGPVSHLITPAKIGRNYRNRLFAINHTDMLTRHQLSDFKRETIAFAKTSVSMLESFAILAVHKNYLRTKFKKPHASDPRAHIDSPAMHLGLRDRIPAFREFFATRISRAHVTLCEDWQLLFERKDPFSRRPIYSYSGI